MWLMENHNKEKEIWLIYYKKHTGRKRIAYDDAVEEALCFGWVDSIVKRVDDETYMQKFTPRKDRSSWSDLNKQRVEKLINSREMTEAGMAKIEIARKSGAWDKPVTSAQSSPMPVEFKRALSSNGRASEFFSDLPPSARNHYVAWIASAKKQATKERRVKEAIGLLNDGQKLGMK